MSDFKIAGENNDECVSQSQGFHCSVCNIIFSEMEIFLKHVESVEHANKITEKNQQSVTKGNAKSIMEECVNMSEKNGLSENMIFPQTSAGIPNYSNAFASYATCDVCKKHFTGSEPYKQHLASDKHKKNVAKMSSASFGGNTSSSASPDTYFCSTCNKQMSGPIPFEQHINSDQHRKKIQTNELLKSFGKEGNRNGSLMESQYSQVVPKTNLVDLSDTKIDSSQAWFCTICLKQCSGPIPYSQHLNSGAHLKNSMRYKMLGAKQSASDSMDSLTQALNRPIQEAVVCSTEKLNVVSPGTFDQPDFNHNQDDASAPVNMNSDLEKESKTVVEDTIFSLETFNVLKLSDLNLTVFEPDEKLDFNAAQKKVIKVDNFDTEMEIYPDDD